MDLSIIQAVSIVILIMVAFFLATSAAGIRANRKEGDNYSKRVVLLKGAFLTVIYLGVSWKAFCYYGSVVIAMAVMLALLIVPAFCLISELSYPTPTAKED